jgi:hypothetical protein
MRLSHSVLSLAIVLSAGVLAACGGGGHASVVPAPTSGGPNALTTAAATQSITFTVNVPGRTAASAVRQKQYVGAGTKSATFSAASVVVNTPGASPSPGATAPPTFAPTPSASADVNCTTTCTATLSGIPVGMVAFTVNLYDAPVPAPSVAQGNLISSGSTTQLVTTSTTSVNLTFNGVPVAVQLNSATNPIPNPSPMATVTAMVAMSVQDADGYTIIAPGAFTNAYKLSTSQQPHVVFSPGPGALSVASPGQALTLSYDGSLAAGTVVQLSSSTAGINGGATITAGTIVIGPATPAPTPAAPTPQPTSSASPFALASGTFPVVFQNNTGVSGDITVYVVGKSTADNTSFRYLTSLTSGALAPLPAPSTGTIPGLTLGPNLEVDVPELCSARVYVALGGTKLAMTTTIDAKGNLSAVGPAPWTNGDTSANTIFDFLEYTWADHDTACPNPMGLDVSAVDAIGIPMALSLIQPGQATVGPVGLAPNAGSNVALGMSLLGAPWSTLVQSYQTSSASRTRVINPTHAVASPVLNGGLNFPQNYFDAYMNQMCVTYSSTDLMVGGVSAANVPYVPALPAGITVAYGRYSGVCGTASQTLNFYASPSPSSTPSGVPLATFTGVPKTADALGNAGYFVQANDPGNTIGRILSVGIDRTTFTAPVTAPSPSPTAQGFAPMTSFVQPVCAFGASVFYGGSATAGGATLVPGFITNWYSALAHQYAYNNSVYAFADDDECGAYAPYVSASTYAPYANGTTIKVMLEPF